MEVPSLLQKPKEEIMAFGTKVEPAPAPFKVPSRARGECHTLFLANSFSRTCQPKSELLPEIIWKSEARGK